MTKATLKTLVFATFLAGLTNFSYAQTTTKTQATKQKVATCKRCGKTSCDKKCSKNISTKQSKAIPSCSPNSKECKKKGC